MKTRVHPLVLILVFFGVIGFLINLIANPVEILVSIGFTALVLYLLSTYQKTGRFFPRFKMTAAPHSPIYKAGSKPSGKKSTSSSRKNIPFQVIEGKKGKTKDDENQSKPKMYH